MITGFENPQYVIIELTSRCNLKCYMCIGHYGREYGADMDETIFQKVLDMLSAETKFIELGGIGEPLYTPNIVNKLERIRQKAPRAVIKMYSNGLLLQNADFAEKITNIVDVLHISVNGVKAYKKVMQPHHFRDLEKSLQVLATLREKNSRPKILDLGFIVMKKNMKDIYSFAQLAEKYNADGVFYKRLWITRSDLAREDIHADQRSLERVKADLIRARRYVEENGLEFSAVEVIPEPYFYLVKNESELLRGSPYELLRIEHMPCTSPWTTIQVAQCGKAIVCCNGNSEIGHFAQAKSFLEVWGSVEAQAYRQGLETGKPYGACAHCKLLYPDNAQSYVRNE